mmetsp:Transcript_10545/g.26608  ORF Transcript_10545/g.26608 Transcript_10545/m.26608 type:complete len:372 (+) Transcript_10545:200-1315(+)
MNRSRDPPDSNVDGRIPRKKAPKRSSVFPPVPKRLAKKPPATKPQSCEILRDSRNQLNVSGFGHFYEKAKSRRSRQKVALEQSGAQDSAVALGKSKQRNGSVARKKSFEVEDLGKQLEQKSFLRRASITDGLKRKREVQRREEEEYLDKIRKRFRPRTQPTTVQEEAHRIFKPHFEPAPGPEMRKLHRQKEEEYFKSMSDVAAHGPESESQAQKRTQKRRSKSSDEKQKSKKGKTRKGTVEEVKPNFENSSGVVTKARPVVIDLLSSDSDSDTCENDAIEELTKLLQDEAIGRGANRKEMKFYAQRLFQLGLHSREMILEALNLKKTENMDIASSIVKLWKWMKPFHKIVFSRWVQQEQKTIDHKEKKTKR